MERKAAATAPGRMDERVWALTGIKMDHPRRGWKRCRGIDDLLEHCLKEDRRLAQAARRQVGLEARLAQHVRQRGLEARPAEAEERGWNRPWRDGGACLRHGPM